MKNERWRKFFPSIDFGQIDKRLCKNIIKEMIPLFLLFATNLLMNFYQFCVIH